jgi:hypothetical protein
MPELVMALVPSPDFVQSVVHHSKNLWVVVLPNSPLPILAMPFILSTLERLRMLLRSPNHLLTSSTNLFLQKPFVEA